MKPYTDHFSGLAPAYATCRPTYPAELFAYLAGLTQRHELAWDCAAGSGQATLPLARWFGRVVATDASPTMLDQAPCHPNIEYRAAPAEMSGLASETVDLVTVAQALHWFDTDAFYAEARRVLVSHGVLAVWTYGAQYVGQEALDRVLQRFYSEVVGPYWPAERRLVESGYRTLAFPFLELEAPAFAMEADWTLSQLLGYIRTWSATRHFREAQGHDPVLKLAGELGSHWGEPESARRVHWPLSLRAGRRPA